MRLIGDSGGSNHRRLQVGERGVQARRDGAHPRAEPTTSSNVSSSSSQASTSSTYHSHPSNASGRYDVTIACTTPSRSSTPTNARHLVEARGDEMADQLARPDAGRAPADAAI